MSSEKHGGIDFFQKSLGDPSPSNGGIDFFQKSLGDPSPSNGGIDFFQKSLGDHALPVEETLTLSMAGDPRTIGCLHIEKL